MTAAGHGDLRDELAAYAIGALEPGEAAPLEAHLGDCAGCREYLGGLWPAVDALAASVPQLEPPPALRDRLVASVRDESRRIAAIEAGDPEWALPRGRRRARRFARPATALAAAGILCAGAVGYLLHGGGAPSRSVIPVQPMPAAASGGVSASLTRVDGQAMLRVRRMPTLGRDRVYEVWAERGGNMRAESTFVLRRDGTAMAAVPNLEGASAVLVTEEPRGGSAHPTSPPLLRANLG